MAPAVAPPAKPAVASRVEDTIPDNASFKLMLRRDSAAIDETMFIFKHTATGAFTHSLDAMYFAGFGSGSLASLTTDSVACAIQVLPYRAGADTRLDVTTRRNGIYMLGISYFHLVPAGIHVWLHDHVRRDSLDLRVGNYAFYVDKADSSTYGRDRFRVVLR